MRRGFIESHPGTLPRCRCVVPVAGHAGVAAAGVTPLRQNRIGGGFGHGGRRRNGGSDAWRWRQCEGNLARCRRNDISEGAGGRMGRSLLPGGCGLGFVPVALRRIGRPVAGAPVVVRGAASCDGAATPASLRTADLFGIPPAAWRSLC